jgi:hypothetical protein
MPVSHTDRAVLNFGSVVGSELRALGLHVDLVRTLPQPKRQAVSRIGNFRTDGSRRSRMHTAARE